MKVDYLNNHAKYPYSCSFGIIQITDSATIITDAGPYYAKRR